MGAPLVMPCACFAPPVEPNNAHILLFNVNAKPTHFFPIARQPTQQCETSGITVGALSKLPVYSKFCCSSHGGEGGAGGSAQPLAARAAMLRMPAAPTALCTVSRTAASCRGGSTLMILL